MDSFGQMPITFAIIAVTVLISLIAFNNQELRNKLLFYPYAMTSPNQYHRFVGHGLIHADYIHLFFNMFTLYSFGGVVESVMFNEAQYVLLYVGGLVVASLYDFFKNRSNPSYAALGASGAVSAVVFSTIAVDPWFAGVALFGVLALPNIVFAILYLWYCVYMSRRGNDNIGHNAHFWGSVYGLVFAFIMKPEWLQNFISRLLHPPFLN